MKRMPLALVCLALLLAGCGGGALVEPGPHEIGGSYRVTPRIEWSRASGYDNTELWTINGPLLEYVRFYHDLEDGDALLPERRHGELPRYRSGMAPHEVMELITASYNRVGASRVQAEGLTPAPFGHLDGFRFTLSYVTASGLEYRALVAGAIDEQDQLQLVMYSGTRLHYYATSLPEIEHILASISFL